MDVHYQKLIGLVRNRLPENKNLTQEDWKTIET